MNTPDPWLDRWKSELGPPPRRALDIGCGYGWDARVLTDWGHEVTAIDSDELALETARRNAPKATFQAMDVRSLPGPLAQGYGLVVASLSLHYFDESETRRIFGEIGGLLAPGGRFAFRVNSEDDTEFGAIGSHEAWNCINHKGVQKQFFTHSKILSLLKGWARVHSLEKRATFRFGPRKSFYEVLSSKEERH